MQPFFGRDTVGAPRVGGRGEQKVDSPNQGTVKPPIIPAGREWRGAGDKGGMEIGEVSWQRGEPDIIG